MISLPDADPDSKILPVIAGYTLIAQIYRSDRTLVYRGVQDKDQLPVIIKVLRTEHPSLTELNHLRNQYTITNNLLIAGIVHPLGLEPFQNSYALVMEDCGSLSLKEYKKNHLLSLTKILDIAIQLADILHDLAYHRVIHKDIKPANILIHPSTEQVKLIDFGIASLLPKETPEVITPNLLQGTLAYLAPEQTGRMNRGVDYRADFYALGVTLFELLTQQLPFSSDDPMQLVYYHLAQQPPHINHFCPELPFVLSDIVSKLMAKNAEDRYQTALGIKYDLELCQSQWQKRVKIERFAIATHDICDKFLISEKLYGRESEVQILLQSFDRVAKGDSELILVSGFSGIGKTAIVNEVHKPITRSNGYFIRGKFDQFNRNIPFAAFVQAFRQLMEKLLASSNTELEAWKFQILEALDDSAQVMIEVIPELVKVVGIQPPAPKLLASAAQNRFNLLFKKFIQVFTTAAHPLVIFLDDLQWADLASLKLIQLLMCESSTHHLLLIGAYRDNEVYATHPLILMLDEVNTTKAIIQKITLRSLDFNSVNSLVMDTLFCSTDLAKPVTELLYRYTKGNPFFVTQLLKVLHQDEAITLDSKVGFWRFYIDQVRAELATDDVVELMTQQLYKLPEPTQALLKLAACIGNQFDLQTLAIVSEQPLSEVASKLFPALEESLILPLGETYKLFQTGKFIAAEQGITVSYKFLHDRVQQAAYSLISEDQKQLTHLQLGKLLLRYFSVDECGELLFEIVNHLNIGVDLINLSQERENLAGLNLAAGRKAKASTAYSAAIDYLATGIALLPETAWESHYPLMLQLHEEIAEVTYLNTEFDKLETWVNIVLQQARSVEDTITVQQTRIMAVTAQGQFFNAIQVGLQVLKTLGIHFPAEPNRAEIEQAFNVTRSLWAEMSPLNLLDLPTLQNTQVLAVMEILTTLIPAAYVSTPNLMPLLVFKQLELSIHNGNCSVSVTTYCDYALILCGVIGDIENGYKFGELALSLLDRLEAKRFEPRVFYVVYAFIKHWKIAIHKTIFYIQKSYSIALEIGDFKTACFSAMSYCYTAYTQGQELVQLLEKIDSYRLITQKYQQKQCLPNIEIYQQIVLNLLGQSNQPHLLVGNIFDTDKSLGELKIVNQRASLFLWHFNQSVLYYLFGYNEEAAKLSIQTASYLDGAVSMCLVPLYSFFDALIQLTQYAAASPNTRQSILLSVQQHLDKLQYWATLAPMNHQHRCELVAAEQYWLLDNKIAAVEAYDQAIALAQQNGFIQDEALANELAAKFYLAWSKPKVAAGYMQEAYDCYSRWGAKAKTDNLEQHYPHLLNFRLTQIGVKNTDMAYTQSLDLDIKTSHSASSTLNQDLDFAAILKASQTLSSTINLKDLLNQLTQIILQSSGGDRCVLILPNREGEWYLEAISSLEMTAFSPEPLQGNQQVPVKLIQYVKNSQIPVVIDNLDTDLPIIDDYLTQQQPKSILCLPILNQAELTGILYLHNKITSSVFTHDRIQILNLLCTQAAISLKNAKLYQESQRNLETLKSNESRLQSLSNNLPGAIVQIYINPQTGSSFTSYISSGCYELYEVTAEAMTSGQYSMRDFEHPDDQERIVQAIHHSAAQLVPFLLEFRIITHTGKIKWIQAASQPTPMPDDWIVWDGLVMDISDRKHAELELQKTNAELVRATRLKDEFLATVSHELRTPLNAILGMTEGLRDEIFGSVTDRQIKALETIETSSSHLLELINDILDVAKIEAGQLELNCTSISLANLCSTSLTFIQQQAQAKYITLETKLPSHLPNLWGDELRIRQVLINLLNNAVKFTPQGGSISLQITPPQSPSQDMVSGLSKNYLQIAIRDTGIGIAPEHINKLFQPFSQIDGRLNRNYEGTGLGLALVKRIVELHGGRVSLTSQVGIGSCFMIDLPCNEMACTLPFDPQPTPWLDSSQGIDLLPPKAPVVLLAEDNEANSETLSSYLRAKGYDIMVAKDGLEAINFATLYSPDLILMDIQMPKMDGIEAIQQIRLDSNLANMPIIALTALAMPGDQERCIAVGANDYLSKPVKLKQLVVTIQKLLDHTKLSINKK